MVRFGVWLLFRPPNKYLTRIVPFSVSVLAVVTKKLETPICWSVVNVHVSYRCLSISVGARSVRRPLTFQKSNKIILARLEIMLDIYIYIYIIVCTYIYIYIYIHIHTHMCIAYIYIYIYIHTYVCVYIYTQQTRLHNNIHELEMMDPEAAEWMLGVLTYYVLYIWLCVYWYIWLLIVIVTLWSVHLLLVLVCLFTDTG